MNTRFLVLIFCSCFLSGIHSPMSIFQNLRLKKLNKDLPIILADLDKYQVRNSTELVFCLNTYPEITQIYRLIFPR